MNESQSSMEWQNTTAPAPVESSLPAQSDRRPFRLAPWEIGALVFSLLLVAFVAIPNYFSALDTLRGKECTARLTLLAQTLRTLAEQNGTRPGERICEQFDLNEALEKAQGGGLYSVSEGNLPLFYKIGAEPDCPDPQGDHSVSLMLGQDGKVIPPTCSLGSESGDRGLHICEEYRVYPPSNPTADSESAAGAVPSGTDVPSVTP